jgi:cyclic beta-1,2-glucan synthetase
MDSLKTAQANVQRILQQADEAARFMDQKFKDMNFSFLLDSDRLVFAIGNRVEDDKLDTGFYDLLGSESRLASFVAIAKGDVPQEHWFRLGRELVGTADGSALASWTASMFEYLMPVLVMRQYENSLLSQTAHVIVAAQIRYGQERRVPWGISESGYNARDLQLNYQYGPFGVPGLGLKRGLRNDLVISPYSTMLAAMINPVRAFQNLLRLVPYRVLTDRGFYESIDFTPERLEENQKFAIVQSFMAHHQGMSLVAINNVTHQNLMQERFHRDPRVRATSLLLQESAPAGAVPVRLQTAEAPKTSRSPSQASFERTYHDPYSSHPHCQLLSNGSYSVMVSTA